MSIRVSCLECSSAFKVPDHTEGRQAKCPHCGQSVLILAVPVPISQILLSDSDEEDHAYRLLNTLIPNP